jgi:hypothetical protein
MCACGLVWCGRVVVPRAHHKPKRSTADRTRHCVLLMKMNVWTCMCVCFAIYLYLEMTLPAHLLPYSLTDRLTDGAPSLPLSLSLPVSLARVWLPTCTYRTNHTHTKKTNTRKVGAKQMPARSRTGPTHTAARYIPPPPPLFTPFLPPSLTTGAP